MKVKIKGFKNLKFSQEPIVYDMRIKNKGEVLIGTLILNFSKGMVTVDCRKKTFKIRKA